jgi:spermidine synthase
MPGAARTAVLLFFSGVCALVYQVAWLREFRLVFGASTAASAAVVAIFIGGLGLGGRFIGPRADLHPQPLRLYAWLETWVAMAAALSPLLLAAVREAYIAAGGSLSLGLWGGTALRLGLAALVLLAPTVLMGGTLPAASRAAMAASDPGRGVVALLYGANTLGAVVGSLVGTFFMLEVFGTRRTLWLACLINLLVAMVARRMSAATAPQAQSAAGEETGRPSAAPPWFVLLAAAVVGFAFFLMELVWYRMLGPILGGTVFTFGLILSMALLGIGLGGLAYSQWHRTRPTSLRAFALTCLAEAAALALPYALGDRIALLALLLRPLGTAVGFMGHVTSWATVCAIVVLPASIVAGYQFPLLIALLGEGRERLGKDVGRTYAWNTVGAIAGSLAGGFGFLPLLSAPGTWRAVCWLLTVTGLSALVLRRRGAGFGRSDVLPASVAGIVLLLLTAEGPSAVWRHSGIGGGRAEAPFSSPNQLEAWERRTKGSILWEADGLESSVALQAVGPGAAFVINGKIDGNAIGDASTTIMSGLVGALLHPKPMSSMVIGLGTGATAGWLASVPTMERTDVVELEPLVLRVARDCAGINRDVMANPKVRVAIGDAREVLLVSSQRYDLIFSEPSNPYRAGIASLFTREFYEAIARRLTPDGIFLQWVQTYEIDGATLQTIYATLRTTFPEILTWQVSELDLLLVATRNPVAVDAEVLRKRLAEEPYRSGMRATWRVTDLEGFLAWFIARRDFAREVPARLVNTDDQNIVEFGFARSVGRSRPSLMGEIRELSRERGLNRPTISHGAVDWRRVDEARITLGLQRSASAPDERALVDAAERHRRGDYPGFVRLWGKSGHAPQSPYELTVVAQALADGGDEAAEVFIEALSADEPVAADCLRGRLRARQGRLDEAVAFLEAAFHGAREDPWTDVRALTSALTLAPELGATSPERAERLRKALDRPLALYAFDDLRLRIVAELASRTELNADCVALADSVGPQVPWSPEWLQFRVLCFEAARDARLPSARAELQRFVRSEPRGFGLGPARPAPSQPVPPSPDADRGSEALR